MQDATAHQGPRRPGDPDPGGGRALPDGLVRAGYQSWTDVVFTWLVGGGFALVALAAAARGPLPSLHDVVTLAGLLALFVVAFRTEFSRSFGATVATQPILLAMVLCTPLHLVPLTVAIGLYLATMGEAETGSTRLGLLRLAVGANCLGLVGVVWAMGMTWDHWSWGTIALAYAAQTALDVLIGGYRAHLEGAPMRLVAVAMGWTIAIDGLLGIVGLAIIVLAGGRMPGLLLLGVPIALIWMLARDRQATYEEAKTLESAFTEVTEQARIDPLTGLANRRVWEEAVARAGDAAGEPVALHTVTCLLADLDHLKLANDTFGHDAGDRLLVELAWILTESAPPGAVVARIGGDEFGILVIGGEGEPAPDLVGSVQGRLAAHAAHTDLAGGVSLSASLGQASAPPCRTVAEALTQADHASRLDKFVRRARRQDHELTR